MKKKRLMLMLVLAGLLVSAYLTYIKLSADPFACDFGKCGVVQASSYSELFGIPVATWGAVFYLALGASILANLKKPTDWLLIWGIAFSSYLTYIELFILKAVCGWCVVSFVIILMLALLNYDLPRSRPRRI